MIDTQEKRKDSVWSVGFLITTFNKSLWELPKSFDIFSIPRKEIVRAKTTLWKCSENYKVARRALYLIPCLPTKIHKNIFSFLPYLMRTGWKTFESPHLFTALTSLFGARRGEKQVFFPKNSVTALLKDMVFSLYFLAAVLFL